MKITVISVGRLKEAYWTMAVKEYAKRLGSYCRLELIEVADEKTPERASALQEEQIREKEGERILARLPAGGYVVALAIEGKQLDSLQLSETLADWMLHGRSQLVFLIGGSLGLSREVMDRADTALSVSRMTFPHQLMRVLLLEQLYRAFRIQNHEPYHK